MSKLSADSQIARLANAFHISRAIQVAARLDLGRLLEDGPKTVQELARETETDPPTLDRFLRFLVQLEVVEEVDGERFGPTPLSEVLHLIDNVAQGDEAWAAWSLLPETLRSGESAFPKAHGVSFYDYVAQHPKQRDHWDEWNARIGRSQFPILARRLNLEEGETVVDIGGGRGDLLAEILQAHPGSRGILVDLPDVVAEAPRVLREAGVEDRCRIVPGSAFEPLPNDGDLYLLTRVLMNWADKPVVKILTRCREAMAEDNRLLIVETLMPERDHPRRTYMAGHDLNLLLLWGGRHRTPDEMKRLLEQAGLTFLEVHDDSTLGWQMVEAGRATAQTPPANA